MRTLVTMKNLTSDLRFTVYPCKIKEISFTITGNLDRLG